MKRIAYLLHRFPEITDTFIKREIRSLQMAGTDVQVVSVWRPREFETTPEIISQWSKDTHFVLPKSVLPSLTIMFGWMLRAPGRLLSTVQLAFTTARPGLHGLSYQLFYLLEAILAAGILRRNA